MDPLCQQDKSLNSTPTLYHILPLHTILQSQQAITWQLPTSHFLFPNTCNALHSSPNNVYSGTGSNGNTCEKSLLALHNYSSVYGCPSPTTASPFPHNYQLHRGKHCVLFNSVFLVVPNIATSVH